ncbi:MAG: 50S ribosomal protein L10 [bacterium]|jgi:large subunit ribosomal protein L10
MALTKLQKNDIISEIADLLSGSKMTVVANYEGTTVKSLQQLRRDATENGTTIKVVKNRLVIQALKSLDDFKDVDSSALEGMLLYAFNDEDEVSAAQVLKTFSKKNPSLNFVGGISAQGEFMSADDVNALAGLPSKNQLLAGLIYTLNAPLNSVTGSLSGNLHGLLDGIKEKAK